jgi:uncharacterized protein (TIRG00374 family)
MLKKNLVITLKVLISGSLIWYLLKDINIGAAQLRLQEIKLAPLLIAITFFLLQILLGGLRWCVVSNAIHAPINYVNSIRIFYIGMFFNQALPGGTGGDAIRVYLAYKDGLEIRGAINGVTLERLFTFIGLVLLVDMAQPFLSARIDLNAVEWVLSSAILLTLGTIFGLTLIMTCDRFFKNLDHWRIIRGLSNLSADTRQVFFKLSNVFPITALGLLTHINLSICVFFLAQSLELDVRVTDCLMLVPPVFLITVLPISIGGWGIRETAMVTAFGLIGVPNEGALVLSILIGLVGLGVSLPGGMVWLLSRERRQGATLDTIETQLTIKENSEFKFISKN